MALTQYTTRQMFVSVTWICVGFALIGFSLQAWNLPLDPSYDLLSHLEPFVSTMARVFGGAIVYWGIVVLLTPKPTADILIAAVVGVIPGMLVGVLINHFLLPKNTVDGYWAAWIGMGLVPGAILICLAFWRRRRQGVGNR